MWLTSGRASGRKTLLQYSSPLERECYDGEVQPYRKTDYKPIIIYTRFIQQSPFTHTKHYNSQTLSNTQHTRQTAPLTEQHIKYKDITSHLGWVPGYFPDSLSCLATVVNQISRRDDLLPIIPFLFSHCVDPVPHVPSLKWCLNTVFCILHIGSWSPP